MASQQGNTSQKLRAGNAIKAEPNKGDDAAVRPFRTIPVAKGFRWETLP
jgi:hypothetical protein